MVSFFELLNNTFGNLMHIHGTKPVQNVRDAYGHLAYRRYRFSLVDSFPKNPKPGSIYLLKNNDAGDDASPIQYQTYLEMYKQVTKHGSIYVIPQGIQQGTIDIDALPSFLSQKEKKILTNKNITSPAFQRLILKIAYHNNHIMGGPKTMGSQLKAVISLLFNALILVPLVAVASFLIDIMLLCYKLSLISISSIKNIFSMQLSASARASAKAGNSPFPPAPKPKNKKTKSSVFKANLAPSLIADKAPSIPPVKNTTEAKKTVKIKRKKKMHTALESNTSAHSVSSKAKTRNNKSRKNKNKKVR